MNYADALHLLGFSISEEDPSPTLDEVRRAFRRQALLWHPDKQGRGTAASDTGATPPHATANGQAKAATAPTTTATTHAVRTSGPTPAVASSNGTTPAAPPLDPEEHFKRVAAAYHFLLHAADGAAAATSSPATGSGGNTAAAAAGATAGGAAQQQPLDDNELADLLSADLLMEAARMRLSDFDLMFLHQRASGALDVASVWPDAAHSLDDIWRRIRRRVERRRSCKGRPARYGRSQPTGPLRLQVGPAAGVRRRHTWRGRRRGRSTGPGF